MSTPIRAMLFFMIIHGPFAASTLLRAAERPFPVTEAQRQILPDEQILDGVVEAVHRSTVSAQTAGRV